MVDLFDIKSVASEPEFVESKKFQLFFFRNETSKVLDHHETRSVSSSRSLLKAFLDISNRPLDITMACRQSLEQY